MVKEKHFRIVSHNDSSGPYADTLVVYAKTNPNAAKPQHGVTAFLIERGMEGFSSRCMK